ncbi:efflux RND transporter periplasmic adaptor subunit [Inhella sp.]|uniref:efflux RND transporter periplasmic adaptor subunit n=1 Tax=Inhella sp. TaxID=1921806 RepID=UPI0035B34D02
MQNPTFSAPAALSLLAAALTSFGLLSPAIAQPSAAASAAAPSPSPSLTVQAIQPEASRWPQTLSATGGIAAWQEVVIGAELAGARILRLHAQVGDRVKKGQLLAELSPGTLQADLAALRAGLAEAEAQAREARANAERVRPLQGGEALSAQAIDQALAAEASAQARLASLKAQVQAGETRLGFTRIVASDDGLVTAREAVEGAIAQPGQELFRLQRQGRLEWRAEVPGAELEKLRAGQKVRVTPSGAAPVEGRVRVVAPKVDAATRNGLVYVDLPAAPNLRAGLFARGDFVLGEAPVLTLPQTAVLLRDGFAYVFRLDGQRVRQQKVGLGRRQGDRVEIREGLAAEARVVASGVGFLADNDIVRVANGQGAKPAAK